ncbi:non structural protein [Sathuperi virus]|uniref:Non-structural protein NS-S n=1 Tax=Sathuperi virus TaxID=159141 RepID=I7GPW6_9VIRU|nr:non structural protein [Sathuperi virus]BAQ23253.1 non-structural protein [Sathuperi virus]BDU51761.1 non structural protein [Sathuperi virus]
MYHNGMQLHLTRRSGMWHLLVSMGSNSTSVLLESSSSTKRRPRWSYIRRHNQVSILLLVGSNSQWLITIFPNMSQILCQTMPSHFTGCRDI